MPKNTIYLLNILMRNMGLTSTGNNQSVILNFKAGVNGQYSIKENGANNFENVILEDLKTNTLHKFNTNSTYNFAANVNDNPNRFLIHFNNANSILENNTNNDVQIFSVNNTLHLNGKETLEGNLELFDMIGNIVYRQVISNSNSATINLTNLNSSVYIVKYISNNKIITSKIKIQ